MKCSLIVAAVLSLSLAHAQSSPFVSTCHADESYVATSRVNLDHFGNSLAIHGDWNGDGDRDLVVGGMVPATYTTFTTRAWVFLGSANGPATHEVIIFKGVPGDLFGADCCFLPDLNGDGRDEIAIGAPNYDNNRGRVYIFYGREISVTTPIPELDAATWANLIIEGASQDAGGRFGLSLAASRNINGDNLPDLVVGAPGGRVSDQPPDNYPGRAYVFYGPNLTFMAQSLACTNPPCIPAPQWATALDADVILSGGGPGGGGPGDRFGNSVAVVGNIDGVGGAEFIVGAPQLEIDCPIPIPDPPVCPPVVNGPGYARVFRGATGQQLVHLGGSQFGEAFGWSVAGLVDIGPMSGPFPDGVSDFIVGAFRYTKNLQGGGTQVEAGRVWVYSGATQQPMPAFVDSLNGTSLVGERGGDWLGWSVAGAGKLTGNENGDDFVAGAMRATQRTGEAGCPGGQLNGAVYIWDGATGETWKTLVGELERDRLGWDVDAAFIDDDNVVDIISGGMAWTDPDHPTVTEVGKVYLYLGLTLQLLGPPPPPP